MKEILYRAKSLNFSYLWVYGDLIQSKPNKIDGKYSSWIIEKTIIPFGSISTPTEKFIAVDPETVCQYINKSDIKDNKIFEFDIIQFEVDNGAHGVDSSEKITSEVTFSDCGYEPFVEFSYTFLEVKLIGNRFDNPELIE